MNNANFDLDESTRASLAGWEARVQVTYVAPPSPVDDDPNIPATSPVKEEPRPNLVLSRSAANGKTPDAACEEFLLQTAQVIPQLDIMTPKAGFVFRDGAAGVIVGIVFPAAPGVLLHQQHAFRVDADVLTQLVATYAESQMHDSRGLLEEAMKGFRS